MYICHLQNINFLLYILLTAAPSPLPPSGGGDESRCVTHCAGQGRSEGEGERWLGSLFLSAFYPQPRSLPSIWPRVQVLSELPYAALCGCGSGSLHQSCLVLMAVKGERDREGEGEGEDGQRSCTGYVYEAGSIEMVSILYKSIVFVMPHSLTFTPHTFTNCAGLVSNSAHW